MRTIKIENKLHSMDVSRLVFGSANLGYYEPKEAYTHLDTYYELGGRTIDTARLYSLYRPEDKRSSEKAIGEWLARTGLRKDMIIGTKGGHPLLESMEVSRMSKDELEKDLHTSLSEMGCDVIDIYWLHRDDVNRPVGEIMETLNGFIKQGLVKTIGASNWSIERVVEANEYAKEHGLEAFSAIQVQWSYARYCTETIYDDSLVVMNETIRKKCEELNLPVFCFSSQASAVFQFLSDGPESAIPGGIAQSYLSPYVRAENLKKYENIKRIAKKYGVSLTAASVAYLTCNPIPAAAICGCMNVEQWRDSLSVADQIIPFEEF